MWTHEDNPTLIRRLSHVIGQCSAGGHWLDLIPTLFSQQSLGSVDNKIADLLGLVEIIADYCPDDILTHIKLLCNYLSTCFSSTSARVQVACARATGACISTLDDDSARNLLRPALQPIIDVLGTTLQRGDELDAVNIMEHLVEVAQLQPLFFKGSIDHVVNAMLTVAGATNLEFSTRSMALELMITLAETAPAAARRSSSLLNGLIPLAMNLMLEYEDEDLEWAKGSYVEEDLEDNCVLGEEALERAASGLGGRMVVPTALPLIQQFASMTASTSWRNRRAALAAIGRLAEGCTEVGRETLDSSPTAIFITTLNFRPLSMFT